MKVTEKKERRMPIGKQNEKQEKRKKDADRKNKMKSNRKKRKKDADIQTLNAYRTIGPRYFYTQISIEADRLEL
jgi:hypothetical protein